MPGGDGTGPWGLGPGTGRGRGYCFGNPGPGYMTPGPGRFYGGGFGGRGGFGRGAGWRFGGFQAAPAFGYPAPAGPFGPAQEVEWLKAQKQLLEQQQANMKNDLEALEKRIQELENRKE